MYVCVYVDYSFTYVILVKVFFLYWNITEQISLSPALFVMVIGALQHGTVLYRTSLNFPRVSLEPVKSLDITGIVRKYLRICKYIQ